MAGQARRGERGTGRSSRAGSSWALIAAASAAASGSDTATTTAPSSTSVSTKASTPSRVPELPTQATYRNLVLRGLSPDEAANLTAWLAGIELGDSRWTLRQINQLLFLRAMNRSGHFAEPEDPRLH